MQVIPANLQQLKNYRFIDLFAGIGGFHYALKSFGAKGVFASEINKKAAQVYAINHGLVPQGDITQINEKDIPKHDILCGGFPCQAFSIAGKQKGFEDTRGTLFFDIARIVAHHQPAVLLLENVKNFVRHDQGNTLKVVLKTLQELNYVVHYQVLNTRHFGLPQNRERVYLVALHQQKVPKGKEFIFPEGNSISSLADILEPSPTDAKIIQRDDIKMTKKIELAPYTTGVAEFPNRPIQIGIVNKGGQGERIYHPVGHAITLSAHGGGAGAKTGLYLIDQKIRKLSPRECARLQGFPENFRLHESTAQSYQQFGNSVSINVLQAIIHQILPILP
jgi:DNA (cytosine-5)-methyltransferase 1